jgi:hypothetical protein
MRSTMSCICNRIPFNANWAAWRDCSLPGVPPLMMAGHDINHLRQVEAILAPTKK